MSDATATPILDRLDPEIWIVTAAAGARRGGLVATFVSRASIVPEQPRLLVGLSVCHHTRDLVEQSGAMGLHLVGEEQLELVWRFGLTSGRDADKLAGLAVRTGTTGSPLLAEAAAALDCRVEATFDTGDRTVYLGAVVESTCGGDVRPLRMSRLLQLAPPERLKELKAQLARDSARDALLIAQWRRDHAWE